MAPKRKRRTPTRRRAKRALGGVIGATGTMALLGIGAGNLTEKLSKNLGVDLQGLEQIVPTISAFSIGGPIGAVSDFFVRNLPDFFGDQPTTREGV